MDILLSIILWVVIGVGAVGLAVIAILFTLWYLENKR